MSEYKNGKLQLPNVTLAAMDSVRVKATVKALEYSMKNIDFGQIVLIVSQFLMLFMYCFPENERL